MAESPSPLTRGWKVTIVFALLLALGNSGVAALEEREDQRFANHEGRLDALENAVFGNDLGTAPREHSHTERLAALEQLVQALQAARSDDGK